MQTPQEDKGVVLIGGEDSDHARISSVEVMGFNDCSIPNLPEWRINHGSFLTESGSLAVCGGQWLGKPKSSDCLVLNVASKIWERGQLGDLLGDSVYGVISMDDGTYMIHHDSSSFLPTGERNWVAGPIPREKVQCATRTSSISFLAFSTSLARQFDSSDGPSSDEGWSKDGVWPKLEVERYRPGCATILDLCVVAGGLDKDYVEQLRSVEVIYLSSKARGSAKDMLNPRSHFNLIAVGNTLLAFGGNDDNSAEIWEGEGGDWEARDLANTRSHFSALAVTDSVCVDGQVPPQSCPTVDGGSCVFPFKNGKQNAML